MNVWWEQEVTIQYNLCNEPWLKYSMAAVADRGLKPSQWTSARLHKEVLFLETLRERYELSRVDTPAAAAPADPPPVRVGARQEVHQQLLNSVQISSYALVTGTRCFHCLFLMYAGWQPLRLHCVVSIVREWGYLSKKY